MSCITRAAFMTYFICFIVLLTLFKQAESSEESRNLQYGEQPTSPFI